MGGRRVPDAVRFCFTCSKRRYIVRISALSGVEYAYVKAYLFNIDESENKRRPDHRIITDGIWARSKLGTGVPVPTRTVSTLNQILSSDIRALVRGLSKCFTPRHGFVYFDSQHRPVASVSFFCLEGIRVYPKPKVRPLKTITPRQIQSAEKT